MYVQGDSRRCCILAGNKIVRLKFYSPFAHKHFDKPDASVKLTTSVCYNNSARCCFASLFRLFFSRLKLAIVFSLALTSVVSRSLSRKCSTKKHELKHHLKWFEFSCESRISRKTIERSFVVKKTTPSWAINCGRPYFKMTNASRWWRFVCLFITALCDHLKESCDAKSLINEVRATKKKAIFGEFRNRWRDISLLKAW